MCLSVVCFSLQPWLQLRGHDQQVAIGVGEDLLQLDLYRPVRVDTGGSAGPGQQRLWLKLSYSSYTHSCSASPVFCFSKVSKTVGS